MADQLPLRRFYNATSDFVDANVARGLADARAFVDPERSITYGELQDRTCRFAAALKSIGLRAENRLILLAHDTIDFPVAFWGAIRTGIVAVPVNTMSTVEQLAYVLADSRAVAAVVAPDLAPKLGPLLARTPDLKTIIVTGGGEVDSTAFRPRAVFRFADLCLSAPAELSVAPTVSDEVAFWLYTSGSTGDPKAVKHVHTSPMATAKSMGQGIIGIRQADVVFSAAKMFFAYGLGNAMSFPLSVGAISVLWPHRPTPDAVFAIMRQHQPSIFYAVPSLYTALLAHPEIGRGAGSDRLRLCVSAGEALPAHIGERWREIVGVEILDGIGSTEMLQTFISNRPGDIRYGSTGKPVPGYRAKIIDEDGRELGDGEVGELAVSGPSAGEGYWNQRAKTQRTFVGAWVHTGDRYYRDAEGYYHYLGRTDDMFKASGMWVSPFDVEAVLASHEAVLEAAVIGKEDADGLVKPKAFIVLRSGYCPDDTLFESLKSHVKQKAGPWKYPRWIEVCGALPRTATGKLQRFKLRELETLVAE